MSKCLITNIPKKALESFKYEYSYVRHQDIEVEMKDLVLETNHIECQLPISFPFVYFYDFEEEQMQEITNYFKELNIHPICCAHTKTNLLWTFKDLINEIVKEHNTVFAMKTLKELISKVMKLPLNENKEQVQTLLMNAFKVLQEKDYSEMMDMIEKLTQLIRDNSKDA